jgi:hypothetical protein
MEYDINKIRTLCDRYFDGDTTAEEELLLREYFNRTKDIPADLRAVKVMMTGISEATAMTYSPAVTRPKGIVRKIVWGTISAAAAISLFVALSGREVYGYDADGKAITDPQQALESITCLAYLDNLESSFDIARALTLEMENNN